MQGNDEEASTIPSLRMHDAGSDGGHRRAGHDSYRATAECNLGRYALVAESAPSKRDAVGQAAAPATGCLARGAIAQTTRPTGLRTGNGHGYRHLEQVRHRS